MRIGGRRGRSPRFRRPARRLRVRRPLHRIGGNVVPSAAARGACPPAAARGILGRPVRAEGGGSTTGASTIDDTRHAADSAPRHVRYCLLCGVSLTTREVAGKPRRACPACDFVHFVEPKVGVGVMVVEDDRLLLVRRAMEPEKGRWSLPAGYLDYGESPIETAVREAREETGLEVRITGLVDAFHNPPGAGATVFLLYRAERVSGEPTAGDDADAARFFARDELPPLAFASTFAAVERLTSAPGRRMKRGEPASAAPRDAGPETGDVPGRNAAKRRAGG